MQRIAAVCLSLPVLALAPGVANAEPWWGEASAGLLNTSGNSKTSSGNAKFTLDYLQGPWRNAFLSQAQFASDDGETTGERYLVTDKIDYTFYEQNYAFLAADFEKDLFGGIRERTSQTAGLGRHFLTGPKHFLDIELGAGAREQTEQESREKDTDLIARFGTDYQYKINDHSGFRETIKVESGDANTFSQSVTELKLYVIGNLFASVIYTVQHNSQVEPGIKSTDTTTALNFSYAFGKKPG
jgi:putative salt-induced outer membrane protein